MERDYANCGDKVDNEEAVVSEQIWGEIEISSLHTYGIIFLHTFDIVRQHLVNFDELRYWIHHS